MPPPLADDAPPFAGGLTPDPGATGRAPGIFENSALNIGGLVAASVLGFVSGVITANVLGAEGVGILAVVFGLVEFGRGLTNFTHHPSILEVHRGRDEGAVFGTSLVLKYAGAFLFVAIAYLAAEAVAPTFDVPPWAIVLTSTLLVVGAFQEIGTARYEAANRMLERNILVTLGPLVGLLAVLAFVVIGRYNVYTAITTSIIGTAAMSAAFYVHWRHRRFRWDRAIARYLLTYGSKLVLATFLTQALLWTDTLMVSWLLGNEEAGVYHIVFQMTYIMITVSVAIGVAVLPAMSELASRGQDTSAAYHRGTLLALVVTAAIGLFFALSGPLILRYVYGPEYLAGYPALLVLVVFGLAGSLLVPVASLLTVHGRAGMLTLLSLAQAAINVPICYFLTREMGIVGAALATTGVFVVGLVATWLLAKRVTGAWPMSRASFAEAWEKARARLAR